MARRLLLPASPFAQSKASYGNSTSGKSIFAGERPQKLVGAVTVESEATGAKIDDYFLYL